MRLVNKSVFASHCASTGLPLFRAELGIGAMPWRVFVAIEGDSPTSCPDPGYGGCSFCRLTAIRRDVLRRELGWEPPGVWWSLQ